MLRLHKTRNYHIGAYTHRSAAGQAMIAEGAAILALIVFVAVGLLFLILNIGMAMVYQQKVAFIAGQTASYYIAQGTGWNFQNAPPGTIDVNSFAKNLASKMGLPATAITATASPVPPTIITITVTGTNLPLLAGSFLPGLVSVHDTFAADTSTYPRPTGLMSINCINSDGSNRTVLLPCYSGDFAGDWTVNDPLPPHIPGPGMYDQFSLGIPPGAGIGLSYTPGNRGNTP